MGFLFNVFLLIAIGTSVLAHGDSTHESSKGPTQYCQKSDGTPSGARLDFCTSLTTYENPQSSSHNLYLSLHITRKDASPNGWMAVGIGDRMDGALMFVVYGDPRSGRAPIVSIRTTKGHSQPNSFLWRMEAGQTLT